MDKWPLTVILETSAWSCYQIDERRYAFYAS